MAIIDEYLPGRSIPKMDRWSHTAAEMAKALNIVTKRKQIPEILVPFGILRDGRNFFYEMGKILSSRKRHVAFLPESSGSQNYEIARYCLARLDNDVSESGIRKLLQQMLVFMRQIKTPRDLDILEIEVALRLYDLFRIIDKIGSGETYNEMMRESHQHMK